MALGFTEELRSEVPVDPCRDGPGIEAARGRWRVLLAERLPQDPIHRSVGRRAKWLLHRILII
jgi:hypothetical protein